MNPPCKPPAPGQSDRDAIDALIESAAEVRFEPRIEVEQSGLKVDLHLIEPDRAAWHCQISDAQLTTYHVLSAEADVMDVRWAMIQHLAKKVELARAN